MVSVMKTCYKQTEIGVIPEDWDVKKLHEIAVIATGNTPPTRDASNYGDEFLFVSPFDINDKKYISYTEKQLSKKGFGISRKFPKGSILFVCIGSTIGKCAVASVELTSNQQINAIFPSSDFLTDYLYYAVNATAPKIKALAGEQAVPIVNKTQFSETPIALPPLLEQTAIAAALSDVEALMGELDKLIAKKRDIKQATMQQLLTGKKRLAGFNGEWEVKRLGEVAELYQPITISAKQFTESGYPVYGANGIVGFYHDFNHERSQVTVTCRGSTCGTVNKTVEKSWITGNAMVINCDNSKDIEKQFLYYLLLNQDLSICITGTGQPQIVRSPLSNFNLSIPPKLEEQTAIATILSDMDAEINALQQKRDKTAQLKQGMMQELLTGRIRLC